MCENEGKTIYGLAQKGHSVSELTNMKISCRHWVLFKMTGARGYPGSYILITQEILETVQSVQTLSDQRKHWLEASPKLRPQGHQLRGQEDRSLLLPLLLPIILGSPVVNSCRRNGAGSMGTFFCPADLQQALAWVMVEFCACRQGCNSVYQKLQLSFRDETVL